MHLFAEFLESKLRLMGRTGTDPVQGLPDKRKQSEHGKAFQGQQDFTAGSSFNIGQNL